MMKKSSDKRVGVPLTVNISDGFWGIMAPCSKALASVNNNSSSRGISWGRFVGPQCLLGKVENSIDVWWARCLQPDEDIWSLNVCWRYLIWARIGWDQSRRQSRICGNRKKELTQDQRLLIIFGLRTTSVGGIWLGLVSVHDIWSWLTSVEDVNALAEVLRGLQPCGCVGGR